MKNRSDQVSSVTGITIKENLDAPDVLLLSGL